MLSMSGCPKKKAYIPRSPWVLSVLFVAAAILPLAIVTAIVPGYLTHRGFPLDDAWIHMVYGRSLAEAHMLAYNPGTPTVGETSPLWAVVMALPHCTPLSIAGRVTVIKLLGWMFHASGAAFVGLALGKIDRETGITATFVILLHPELAAAAVSGMEVPLAEVCIGLQLWALSTRNTWVLFIASLLTPFARPEVGILAPLLGFLQARGKSIKERLRWSGIALLGAMAGYGLMFGRNDWVAGSFIPSTFHQKVTQGLWPKAASLGRGMTVMLPSLVPAPLLLLGAVLLGWIWLLYRQRRTGLDCSPVWIGALGLLLIAVCSALIEPREIPTYYHRRYLLVGLPLLLIGMTYLGLTLTQWLRPFVRWALIMSWILGMLASWPSRFHHLDNDAHNIDDVQVAVGCWLAQFPQSTNFWAVDAGAVRYFGNSFVVDLMGLNTPEIFGRTGPAFLSAHPAHILEVVITWDQLHIPEEDISALHLKQYAPSTAYTVTLVKPMAMHQILTTSRLVSGHLQVLSRDYPVKLCPLPSPIFRP